VVNIISAIAIVGVAVGTMAMVVTLSIFNGLDVLIKQFFSVFDPQLKITAVEGTQFDPTTPQFSAIRKDPSVVHFCEVAEEIALLRYENRQFIANIKGVTDEYFEMNQLDSFMFDGHLLLNDGNFDYTVIGRGVAYNLGASSEYRTTCCKIHSTAEISLCREYTK
jgi:lipoprotein-releasing system permease protein